MLGPVAYGIYADLMRKPIAHTLVFIREQAIERLAVACMTSGNEPPSKVAISVGRRMNKLENIICDNDSLACEDFLKAHYIRNEVGSEMTAYINKTFEDLREL